MVGGRDGDKDKRAEQFFVLLLNCNDNFLIASMRLLLIICVCDVKSNYFGCYVNS